MVEEIEKSGNTLKCGVCVTRYTESEEKGSMSYLSVIPPDLKDTDSVKSTQVAKWLKVTTATLRAWGDRGILPKPMRFGPKIHRFNVGELRRALQRLDNAPQVTCFDPEGA